MPPDVSLHPFFTWRKDVPARHECIKNHALLNRSGLRATFFCPRRQKKAKTPPGFPRTPGILSVLFSGESPHRYHKNQRYIRGHGPRLWAATCFQSRAQPVHGAPGPLFIRVGFGSMVRVDFPEKKIDKAARGFRGFPPDASFSPFFAERKGVPKAQPVLYGMSVYKREPIRCRLRIGSYSA